MEVKSSKAVSVSEAAEILAGREKEGELGYEQSQALEHGKKFAKLEPDKVKKIAEAITKNAKISPETAVKIADISPQTPATIRAILLKDRVELSEEEIEKILKEFA
jgi:DNA-directed RNA polymerase subunit F